MNRKIWALGLVGIAVLTSGCFKVSYSSGSSYHQSSSIDIANVTICGHLIKDGETISDTLPLNIEVREVKGKDYIKETREMVFAANDVHEIGVDTETGEPLKGAMPGGASCQNFQITKGSDEDDGYFTLERNVSIVNGVRHNSGVPVKVKDLSVNYGGMRVGGKVKFHMGTGIFMVDFDIDHPNVESGDLEAFLIREYLKEQARAITSLFSPSGVDTEHRSNKETKSKRLDAMPSKHKASANF